MSEGMERLLPVINQLQDVFSKVSMVHEIDLPQIVVVGAQSTGKSSVLENIVGKDFLPRGSGIVTRRPLVLQMTHLSHKEHKKRLENGEPTETAKFLHKPDIIYTDFREVKREIENETDKMCGTSKGVCSDPIRLDVTSNHVLDLTVIDLPGLTKIAVDGQQQTVGRDIETMALEWIKPKNTIILAVTAANTDIANSDALQLARRVDPNGDRTIGVLTKLDLMDHGTNCVDVLTGNVIKLKKGFVGLVNRSQQDIDNCKDIQAALRAESDFFMNHPAYSPYSKQLGTDYLTRNLSHNLLIHIRACLPQLKQNIQKLLEHTMMVLKEHGGGENEISPDSRLLTLLNAYAKVVVQHLDGTVPQEKVDQARGARINAICSTGFVPYLEKLNPLDDIDDTQITTIISSCQGTRNKLFIPEQAFENLVRKCIKKLESPSHKCVDYVHDELLKLADDAAVTLERYPNLKDRVVEFMKTVLSDYKDPLTRFVSNLIDMESAHINTGHPEFYDGGSIDKLVAGWAESARGAETSPSGAEARQHISTGNVVSDFHDQVDFSAPIDQKSVRETEIVKELVTTYYVIVRRHMQDHVPKSIIHFLVNKLKDTINTKLVETFYKQDLLETLLDESEEVARRRRAAKEMAACLKEAMETLNKVREFKI
eukprot:TRINITY_DN2646_c2_g2_i5.p1 TRINITY_DN2646_c2_g2~~TRINITY_DN2646_c2_g2_i5.p1  ORF type:complete len:654 (+),score=179.16 TRINITY_DN2646_c2_g2_i5:58-2019(+)